MADNTSNNSGNRNVRNGVDDEEQNEENEDNLPDIGLGPNQIGQNSRECSINAGINDSNRREDNPVFSFKHFLSGNSNCATSSSASSSRPKQVYQSMSPPLSPNPRMHTDHIHQPRIHEVTSGLPDFVQDHLVIEQCYLNNSNQQPMAVDLDHLPDFTGHDNYESGYCRTSSGQDTSLPDFLSDGPIRSERRDSDSPPISPQPADIRHSPRYQIENERLRLENERLRRELEAMRRQLSDQITRSETLEAELSIARNQNQPDIDLLLEQMKQQDEHLKRANKRVIVAENRADKLKQEVQSLRNELEAMRCREGTASTSALQSDSERLASQLRNAANTAELSLRHLLIGVDNLRQLAASIESQQAHSSRRRQGVMPGSSNPSLRNMESSDESLDDDFQSGPAL